MSSVVPTPEQLRWQRDRFGLFFHFGPNTALDLEWGDGTAGVDVFNPAKLDADGWVRTAAELGARYVVLTAKHHDGFCLWPTATTNYSVASSTWRDGTGDVVREVADACARHGVRFGVYLSPWDRHEPTWGTEPDAYNRIFTGQLRELCTKYGELCEIWFDGAGSEHQAYDWDAAMAVIDELQPGAMVFNMGRPTIRWVGNEDGVAADPVEYVVSSTHVSNYTDATDSLTTSQYLPPECDVSVRPGWFWHANEDPKSVDHLLAVFYRSIGLGANLLLNVPPTADGELDARDVARLLTVRREMEKRFATPIPSDLSSTGTTVVADFGREISFDHLVIEEELDEGQRVQQHVVIDDDGTELITAGTIGMQRIHVRAGMRTRRLHLRLTGDAPRIRVVTAFAAGTDWTGEIEYTAPTEPLDSTERM
ncbi:alpha-L-fucosidase [Actinoplanes couchii]|uniref:alpha-L-fucosidase n=1 Tax=Actinoplanes couchii TaxID=403638 RepID=A0ABQ3X8I7_9ACTN|nr:alpha-L-fucosidase [Actinoplanes couchii]MDR6320177.1 alpha-L-fucosidase [Actinoplanes couchii]GID54809.1 alpha-L-fucosidase [Actinoplanes couchii]